jgi:hypothetical protein
MSANLYEGSTSTRQTLANARASAQVGEVVCNSRLLATLRPIFVTISLSWLQLSGFTKTHEIISHGSFLKAKAIEYLQKQWTETCTLKARIEEPTEALRIFADDESRFLNGRRDPNSSNFEGQAIARAALQKDAKP